MSFRFIPKKQKRLGVIVHVRLQRKIINSEDFSELNCLIGGGLPENLRYASRRTYCELNLGIRKPDCVLVFLNVQEAVITCFVLEFKTTSDNKLKLKRDSLQGLQYEQGSKQIRDSIHKLSQIRGNGYKLILYGKIIFYSQRPLKTLHAVTLCKIESTAHPESFVRFLEKHKHGEFHEFLQKTNALIFPSTYKKCLTLPKPATETDAANTAVDASQGKTLIRRDIKKSTRPKKENGGIKNQYRKHPRRSNTRYRIG